MPDPEPRFPEWSGIEAAGPPQGDGTEPVAAAQTQVPASAVPAESIGAVGPGGAAVSTDPVAAARPGRRRRIALTWARILLALDVAGTLLVVWLPARDAERVTGLVAVLASLVAQLGIGYGTAYDVLEFLANVAFFVPLGVLLPAALPRLRGPLVVLAGFAFSGCIELVQLALPSRVSTWSDVVANTLGALLGWLAWTAVRCIRRGRRA